MLTEIRISRSALVHNVSAFRRVIGPQVKLMAVVKSNAYGHGVGECAPVFAKAGVDWFGVASVTEALQLQTFSHRKPVAALSYADVGVTALRQAIIKNIRLPAYTLEQLKQYNAIARQTRSTARVHVKFDTGTTRVGFLPNELPAVLQQLTRSKYIFVEGVYSHFAEVERKLQVFSNEQLMRFTTLAIELESFLGRRVVKHIDCSAGVLLQPTSHLDMVRVGMSLYGIHTTQDVSGLQKRHPGFALQPALSWVTKVIQVKRVPKGTTIGYNRTYVARRPTTIAVLPVGYWEGLDRGLSNCGSVLVHGKISPIRGRVCMNVCMIDVTAIKNVQVGDEVVLIGKQGRMCISADQLAQKLDTIPYEVVTRLNPLIPRKNTS